MMNMASTSTQSDVQLYGSCLMNTGSDDALYLDSKELVI